MYIRNLKCFTNCAVFHFSTNFDLTSTCSVCCQLTFRTCDREEHDSALSGRTCKVKWGLHFLLRLLQNFGLKKSTEICHQFRDYFFQGIYIYSFYMIIRINSDQFHKDK